MSRNRSGRRWIVVTRRRPGEGDRPPDAASTIPLDEWLRHVAADPTLERVRLAANENETLREAHPVRLVDGGSWRWLYWMSGELWATLPDPAMLAAMRRVAQALGARLGDDERLARPATARADDRGMRRVAVATEAWPPIRRDEIVVVERRGRRTLLVAGTVVCAASMLWLMQP